MKNLDALGINSYVQNLPRGDKENFKMSVALAIGCSYSAVCKKLQKQKWNEMTELPIINKLIQENSHGV
jgi:ubiquinone biosynthesis protein Coq4